MPRVPTDGNPQFFLLIFMISLVTANLWGSGKMEGESRQRGPHSQNEDGTTDFYLPSLTSVSCGFCNMGQALFLLSAKKDSIL